MLKTVTLNPGESRQVDFTFSPKTARVHQVSVDGLTGSFEAIMGEPGIPTIYGTVSDAQTGLPIYRAIVALYKVGAASPTYKVFTDESGAYSVTAERLIYDVWVGKSGYTAQWFRDFGLFEDTQFDVAL